MVVPQPHTDRRYKSSDLDAAQRAPAVLPSGPHKLSGLPVVAAKQPSSAQPDKQHFGPSGIGPRGTGPEGQEAAPSVDIPELPGAIHGQRSPRHMIRRATIPDIPAIYAMGRAMWEESRYRELYPWDERTVMNWGAEMLTNPEGICLIADQNAGFLFGGVQNFYFSRTLMALQVLLYVCPEKRGGRTAFALVQQFDRIAREMGAKEVFAESGTGVHPEMTGRFFESMGYKYQGPMMTKIL